MRIIRTCVNLGVTKSIFRGREVLEVLVIQVVPRLAGKYPHFLAVKRITGPTGIYTLLTGLIHQPAGGLDRVVVEELGKPLVISEVAIPNRQRDPGFVSVICHIYIQAHSTVQALESRYELRILAAGLKNATCRIRPHAVRA